MLVKQHQEAATGHKWSKQLTFFNSSASAHHQLKFFNIGIHDNTHSPLYPILKTHPKDNTEKKRKRTVHSLCISLHSTEMTGNIGYFPPNT